MKRFLYGVKSSQFCQKGKQDCLVNEEYKLNFLTFAYHTLYVFSPYYHLTHTL